jgi:dolichol-phosphate mannosyltransferase
LVCVPTYNEAENIEKFLNAVFENIPPESSILVIDDNSPDGTARIVNTLQGKYPGRLYLLNRPDKQGLAAAYLAAFNWGIERGYEVFLEMDADFSHNPAYIPVMLEEIAANDVVIGSRNIPGGGVENWSFVRNLVSKGGSFYFRAVLRCPVKDLTGGFTMWRKTALENLGLQNIVSRGYLFQVEMKYRAYIAGCSVKEIPIVFPNRKFGVSKMSNRILVEALFKVWKIKFTTGSNTADICSETLVSEQIPLKSVRFAARRARNCKDCEITNRVISQVQFVKFALTGGLGAISNLGIFFLCADKAGMPETAVSIGCFVAAGTQNYFVNHYWSFADTGPKKRRRRSNSGFCFCPLLFWGFR